VAVAGRPRPRHAPGPSHPERHRLTGAAGPWDRRQTTRRAALELVTATGIVTGVRSVTSVTSVGIVTGTDTDTDTDTTACFEAGIGFSVGIVTSANAAAGTEAGASTGIAAVLRPNVSREECLPVAGGAVSSRDHA
jgi:hypothetical protein